MVSCTNPNAALLECVANFPIQHHIGAAELIDGLFGIAHDEQLARLGRNLQPIRFVGIVGGKQQQDFSLQRIGVLKFIDEDVRETILQIAADIGFVTHQIAREQEQIYKIQFAGAAFQSIVMKDKIPHFTAQNGRQIGVGGLLEGFQLIE